MITQLIKCDRCQKAQEKDGPLAPGEEPIHEYSIGPHYRHLCGPCAADERALLSKSVWADAFGLKECEPFERAEAPASKFNAFNDRQMMEDAALCGPVRGR